MTIRRPATSPRAKRYSSVKLRFALAEMAVTAAAIWGFQVFLARPVHFFSQGLFGNFPAACLIFTAVFLIFLYISLLPIRIASAFFTEKAFHLSQQSFGAWAGDEAKSAALSLFLSVMCVEFFYAAVFYFPSRWWIVCSLGWIGLSVVMASLMPVVVIPLFFKYLPIGDKDLGERLRILAKSAGLEVADVCRIDLSRKTLKANAALVGIGKTRKVILADTLTDNFLPGEVEVVAAHEFGHYKRRHIPKLILFSSAVTFLGLFILSRISRTVADVTGAGDFYDLRVLPAVFLLVYLFDVAVLPLRNYVSRQLEREADGFALDVTGDDRNFISVMNKLAEMNFADREPSRLKKIFFYSHPPINERIAFAEEWGKDR
jgi:STE24 endopeptidase